MDSKDSGKGISPTGRFVLQELSTQVAEQAQSGFVKPQSKLAQVDGKLPRHNPAASDRAPLKVRFEQPKEKV